QTNGVVLGSLRRDEPEREVLLESIGAIHCAGYPVDWTRQAVANARVVGLPSYPWHRQRYWMEQAQRPREQIAPLIHRRTELPHAPGTHLLELDLDLADRKLAYLAEHEVASEPWLAGSAIVELAYQAAALVYGARAVALEDIAFERAIVLSRTEPLLIQIVVSPDNEIQLFSSGARHARARVRLGTPGAAARMSLSTIQQSCTDRASLDAMYVALAAGGVSYGPAFRVLSDVHSAKGEALGKLRDLRLDRGYVLHPALLDAGVQVLGVAAASAASDREAVVATGVGEVVVHGAGNPAWIHARSRRENGVTIGDIAILDANGAVIASASGFRFAAASSVAPHDKLDRMMRTTAWHVEERGASRTLDGTTVIFANDDRIRVALEGQGARVVTVRAGTSYVQRDATHFEVSPDTKADFARLFEAITPTRVIYLWGADLAAEDVANVERLACRAVVYLVQGLVASSKELPALTLVTSGAQPVRASGSNPAQMPLWGLGASLVHELPELHLRLVDLDPASPLSLVDELTASSERVALRGSERLVPRLERYDRVASSATIRPDRTYLITGGLGGLGLVAARRLHQLGARHLILMGRSAPSPSVQREIDALGARVVRADVANESHLARALAEITVPLAGVIHAAGVSDDAVVINLDATKIRNVLAPKVQGAWNLHRLTEHLALDFFVSFGSGSAVVGAPGIAHYAAANAFLDGLAHYRKHRGLPAMTIDWSGWAEVGMATRPEVAANIKNQGGALLSTADGSELLERLLAEPAPQVSVLAVDRSRATVASSDPLVDAVRAATTEALRLEALQAYLRAAIAKVTRLSPESVKPEVAFATLGVDSLMMITVKNAIERELGCTISTATLYAKPTLRALAIFLQTKFFAAATEEPIQVVAPALPSSELPVDVDDLLADLKNRGYLDE
ncbi:MAG TPA: type I polyketide synthase, partial [Kofleriaceae bacterium]